MDWYRCEIIVPIDLRDVLSGLLPDIGSTGAVENARGLEAWFPSEGETSETVVEKIMQIAGRLKTAGFDTSGISVSCGHVADADWNLEWKRHFSPLRLGGGVTVAPPWDVPAAASGEKVIIIDPASAFGTGHHETTGDCVMLIHKYAAGAIAAASSFADIGTGTGLLAIAAAKCGFASVAAIDNDPDAVSAAVGNVALNSLNSVVDVILGSIGECPDGCGMIAANLLSGLLVEFMPHFAEKLAAGGLLIASGMLSGQDEMVASAMADNGIYVVEKIENGNWVTIVGRK
ncbi:MAG: 50S ribosomal protein L11 methyltransferase [Nitrospirae bacterium]|nr:50S ribosomal protein L11 methyltransferase [Nitrospirota bacterium]